MVKIGDLATDLLHSLKSNKPIVIFLKNGVCYKVPADTISATFGSNDFSLQFVANNEKHTVSSADLHSISIA